MSNPFLELLASDDYSDKIGFVLPTIPLRRLLQKSDEVRRVATALRFSQITVTDIREFVGNLLEEFRVGEVFRHDIALAALAVAMEHWKHPLAEEYLIDLARINRQEFRASFRVARECLKARYQFPKTLVKTSRYPNRVAQRPAVRAMSAAPERGSSEITIRWKRYSETTNACH